MKKIFIPLMLLVFLVGCAGIRKDLIQVSKEDVKNADTLRVVAKNFLSTWSLHRGIIDGFLLINSGKIMPDTLKTLNAINLKAVELKLWNEEDYKLGYSLGCKGSGLPSLTIEIIKLYAPEILQFISVAF